MCGIAGILHPRPLPLNPEVVRGMWDRIAHRGPDDLGCLTAGPAGVHRGRAWPPGPPSEAQAVLLHRRLSILDLTETGWQPMSTPDGRLHIVLNGEIYNYLELAAELRRDGVTFRSTSDTEVLLHALDRWGLAALPRLVGMFAFALLDTERRRLTLARDFFGIKPLYYSTAAGTFAFCSEVKGLLCLPWIGRKICPQELYNYIRLGRADAGDRTLLEEIRQLPAAHSLVLDFDAPERVEPLRYWTPPLDVRIGISFEEAAIELRRIFLANVELHLRSDVPVGAALSGGVDSSAVVMAMRHLAPGLAIHTFSFVPQDPRISEEAWIDIVTAASGSRVSKVTLGPDDLARDLDALLEAQDLPFESTSIYAQHRVFGRAKEAGIKVVLDGQGADEILGGYTIHKAARLLSLLRQGRWREAMAFYRAAGRWPGIRHGWLLEKVLASLAPEDLPPFVRRLFGREWMPGWLDENWFAERGVKPASFRYPPGRHALRDQLAASLVETTLPSLLRYEDRNSMHVSVEGRVPFLTPELVGFLFSLPEEYLVGPDGESKRVFRRAMRGLVPDAVLDRRDKVGFLTPEASWLSGVAPLVDRALVSDRARAMPFFRLERMRADWDRMRQGRGGFNSRLWRWFNLITWAEHFGVEAE